MSYRYVFAQTAMTAAASAPATPASAYTGPAHPNGHALWPIPALGIGYGETKIIEAHDLFQAIVTGDGVRPDFADGLQVALIDDAIQSSANSGQWTSVARVNRDTGEVE